MGFSIPIHQNTELEIADPRSWPMRVARENALPAANQVVLVVGLSALVIFAVLAFGCTDRWAIAVMELGCGLLLLLWIWPQISSGIIRIQANPLFAPTVLFGLLVIAQIFFKLSAYGNTTRQELWKYEAYGVLLLLASQCHRISAQRLLVILAVFGFIVALFALVQDLTFNGAVYWYWPSVSTTFGPYANYNHYAGLMEMLTPIPLAMALTDDRTRTRQVFWMIAGMLMAATIFICGSGSGMIAFTVELLFLAGYVIARKNRRTAWTLFAGCLLIASFASWIDDGRMLKKLGSLVEPPLTNSDVVTRLAISRDSLRMVADHPVFGWGLGVFSDVYPQYRSFSTDLFVNQAHNDYVQELVETGFLGFACMIWFLMRLYERGLQNLKAESKFVATRTLGPLVGCTGILVHSFSDFNLHIPANAALFFILCGLTTRPLSSEGFRPRRPILV